MPYVRAFVAGFLSTLIFHQGVIFLFHAMGVFPRAPWNMDGVPPFGVPSVVSLAFWGGVWGIPIWYLMRHATSAAYWVRAIVFGAIGPTAVYFLFVDPLRQSLAAGVWAWNPTWDPKFWIAGLVINGIWGLGLALFMRVLRRVGV
jgi:hypothetical protein